MKLKTKRRRTKTRVVILLLLGSVLAMTIVYELIALYALEGITSLNNDEASWHSIGQSNPKGLLRLTNAKIALHELGGFREAPHEELGQSSIPNIVHYVWCGNKTFTFKHYISVLSVWKTLQPDAIEFHYEYPVLTDKYNDWFDEIKRSIPGFLARPLPRHWDGEEHGCGLWFGIAVLDDRGGTYVSDNVIFLDSLSSYRKENFSVAFSILESKTEVSLVMGRCRHKDLRHFQNTYATNSANNYKNSFACDTLSNSLFLNDSSMCAHLERDLYPEDIFTVDTKFAGYIRKLVYGSSEPQEPISGVPGSIPKIAHYVWFNKKEMTYMMYLSMLSTLYVLNVDKVYIHGDMELYGEYLKRILKDKRVVQVYREKPNFVFGIKLLYTQHRSDIVRADVLLKYGGIYMDWDILWVRPIDDIINTGYDAVVSYDHMPRPPFPNTINLGVCMAKPHSTFVKRWQDALVNYKSKDFLYNAVELPYKIYEKYPETLSINKKLQTMCFHLKCHPLFHKNFKDFSSEQPFDWKTDIYSLHFTYPDPPIYESEETLLSASGMFADVGKYILQKSRYLATSK